MEVINGDFGEEVVQKLAQAVLSGKCDEYNNKYRMCLPKRSSSLAPSVRPSLSRKDTKRDSNSCISNDSSSTPCTSSSSAAGRTSSRKDKASSYEMFNELHGTDSSSKESSEEVCL